LAERHAVENDADQELPSADFEREFDWSDKLASDDKFALDEDGESANVSPDTEALGTETLERARDADANGDATEYAESVAGEPDVEPADDADDQGQDLGIDPADMTGETGDAVEAGNASETGNADDTSETGDADETGENREDDSSEEPDDDFTPIGRHGYTSGKPSASKRGRHRRVEG